VGIFQEKTQSSPLRGSTAIADGFLCAMAFRNFPAGEKTWIRSFA